MKLEIYGNDGVRTQGTGALATMIQDSGGLCIIICASYV